MWRLWSFCLFPTSKNMLKELYIFNLDMLSFEFVPIDLHEALKLGACQATSFHLQHGFRKDLCS